MPTIDVTKENFEVIIKVEVGIVLLDFWAPWCGPCKFFGPVFEAAAEKHPDITFGRVNTEAQQELASALGIRSIPTVMVFRDGILLFSQAGALPPQQLEELISKIRGVNMDEVKRELKAAG